MAKRIKIIFFIIAFFLLSGAAVFFFWPRAGERIAVVFPNGVSVDVSVAKNPAEWVKGLGGRERMGENDGMLFLFPTPRIQPFWMKDMRFPLDFIWIRDGVIVYIHENASEKDQTTLYRPPEPVDAVLEVNAGFVGKNGIRIGDEAKVARE